MGHQINCWTRMKPCCGAPHQRQGKQANRPAGYWPQVVTKYLLVGLPNRITAIAVAGGSAAAPAAPAAQASGDRLTEKKAEEGWQGVQGRVCR